MVAQVISILVAVYFGLLTVIHVLYRTRRTGRSWPAAVLYTVTAAALYVGACIWCNKLAHDAGVDLGKDDNAVAIIQGIAAGAGYFIVAALLVQPVRALWPTRKEREAREATAGAAKTA
jgi:hypothetical protein